MSGVLLVPLVVLGLAVGSFLNVVAWRVPRGESVVRPPSACPRCGHEIRARDNVPVVSWLLLRGRCRDCAAPISWRYPAVEAVTAVAFGGVGLWLGLSWALPAFLLLAAVSVVLAVIDLDVRRLPDVIVLPTWVAGLLLLALASANPGGPADWPALLHAVIGSAVMFAVYFLLFIVYPSGMGFGDVKLAGVLGLYLGWIGWSSLVVGWFAAFLLGGVFSIGLVVIGRAGRKSTIPFGPWMLAGAWVGALWGEAIGTAYLGLL